MTGGPPTLALVSFATSGEEPAARDLRRVGYRVLVLPPVPATLRHLREEPPDAVLVDLQRRPSTGRDFATAVRRAAPTRYLPLVFLGGSDSAVASVKARLPDACFASAAGLPRAIAGLLATSPPNPTVPPPVMAGYSGTPLARKLGIRPGMSVRLASAPPEFEKTLGGLPEEVLLSRVGDGPWDLVIWFVRSQEELSRDLPPTIAGASRGAIWIAWPKRASGQPTDLSEGLIRQTGLAAGLVDFKICAIDRTWSGLRFVTRKSG